ARSRLFAEGRGTLQRRLGTRAARGIDQLQSRAADGQGPRRSARRNESGVPGGRGVVRDLSGRGSSPVEGPGVSVLQAHPAKRRTVQTGDDEVGGALVGGIRGDGRKRLASEDAELDQPIPVSS